MPAEFDAAEFGTEVAKAIKHHTARMVGPLEARIKELEARPPLKYCGVWAAGKTYVENCLVTKDGSLWIAKKTTARG